MKETFLQIHDPMYQVELWFTWAQEIEKSKESPCLQQLPQKWNLFFDFAEL
jgi:hypothetical protein